MVVDPYPAIVLAAICKERRGRGRGKRREEGEGVWGVG